MSEQRVIPFIDLPPADRERFASKANWMIGDRGDWDKIVDTRYGTVEHVTVRGEKGDLFDKVNLQWSPAVFVVPFRINPKGKAEFLLPREQRILPRDENGIQGNVSLDNIPQGLVKIWRNETTSQAAMREVKEETGYQPTDLALIGNIYIDAANSETAFPFYLAHIPYKQIVSNQQLDETETITPTWYTWQKLHELSLKDSKTLIGLHLAEGVMDPKSLKKLSYLDQILFSLRKHHPQLPISR